MTTRVGPRGHRQADRRGHWQDGDPDILVVFDAGYDVTGWPGCWRTCSYSCSGGCARIGVPQLASYLGDPAPGQRPLGYTSV